MASAFSGDPVPLDAVLIVAGTVPAVARAHLVVTERLEMFKRVRKSHGRDFSVNRCAPPLYIRGDEIASRLTPDQRTEAQRLAREWDEAHPRD